MSNAVIIHNLKDYEVLKNIFDDSVFYSSNFYHYICLKDKGVKYLYGEPSLSSNHYHEISQACMSWFRDENEIDIIQNHGISIGPIIARRVITSFANDYRNYLSLLKLSEEYKSILISKKSEISFLNVKKIFKDKVKFFESINPTSSFTSSPDRTKISYFPFVHKLSLFARFLQIPFKILIKSKVLVWSDWSYSEEMQKRKDVLYLNSLIPWKGFYLKKNKKYTSYNSDSEFEKIFPKKLINNFFNRVDLEKRLIKMNIKWDSELIILFKQTIIRSYENNYLKFKNCYFIFKELFSYYSPKAIIFPGGTHFAYLLAIQLAKKIEIKTILALDGYPVLSDKNIFHKDISGKKHIFDKYIAYSSAANDLYNKFDKIEKDQLLISRSPLVEKLEKSKVKFNNSIEILVLAYYPNLHNPNSRWDKRFEIVSSIIQLLSKKGFKNITIKVKRGEDEDNEIKLYKTYLKKINSQSNIKIVSGDLYNILSRFQFAIGQISTACYESAIVDIPYFVYEPYDSGLSELDLKKSCIANFNSVPRNLNELDNSLVNNNAIVFKKRNYISDGLHLSKIKLM